MPNRLFSLSDKANVWFKVETADSYMHMIIDTVANIREIEDPTKSAQETLGNYVGYLGRNYLEVSQDCLLTYKCRIQHLYRRNYQKPTFQSHLH